VSKSRYLSKLNPKFIHTFSYNYHAVSMPGKSGCVVTWVWLRDWLREGQN